MGLCARPDRGAYPTRFGTFRSHAAVPTVRCRTGPERLRVHLATTIRLALVTLRATWREQERVLGDARGRPDELAAAVRS